MRRGFRIPLPSSRRRGLSSQVLNLSGFLECLPDWRPSEGVWCISHLSIFVNEIEIHFHFHYSKVYERRFSPVRASEFVDGNPGLEAPPRNDPMMGYATESKRFDFGCTEGTWQIRRTKKSNGCGPYCVRRTSPACLSQRKWCGVSRGGCGAGRIRRSQRRIGAKKKT
jgi:hypothetical protein